MIEKTYTRWQRFLIACTQLFGQVWFGLIRGEDIYPDESTSAYVWRTDKKRWIRFVNWLLRDADHCRNAWISERSGIQNAPEYR